MANLVSISLLVLTAGLLDSTLLLGVLNGVALLASIDYVKERLVIIESD